MSETRGCVFLFMYIIDPGKYFSYFFKKICCGFSLEAPNQGTSSEYLNVCFHGEIRKISTTFCGEKHFIWGYVYIIQLNLSNANVFRSFFRNIVV